MIAAKGVGICLILAACILAGMELERGLKRRWLILRELHEMLLFLEKEMIFRRTPVPEALEDAAAQCRTEAQALFQKAAGLAGAKRGASFGALWEEAAAASGLEEILAAEEYQETCRMAQALSNTDTVMQKTMLEKYQSRFEEMSVEMERQYREKGALYRKLTAAAGAFLALLFL